MHHTNDAPGMHARAPDVRTAALDAWDNDLRPWPRANVTAVSSFSRRDNLTRDEVAGFYTNRHPPRIICGAVSGTLQPLPGWLHRADRLCSGSRCGSSSNTSDGTPS